MLYRVGDFFQSVAVFCRQGFYGFAHGDGRCVWRIGGKKDAVSRAGNKRHKADDNNDAKCHADAYGNGRNKPVEAGEKVSYGRAYRCNRPAGIAGSFLDTDKIYAEQLANEYAPKDTSKVVALRKLDAKAKLPATVFTYTFGIITSLVAGVGMCLSMKVIGSGSTAMFVLGVIVGIIGLLGIGVNYPIYKKMLAQGKQKYAFEIMELAKEISEK